MKMNEPHDQHGSITGTSLWMKEKKKKEVAEACIECDCSYKALKPAKVNTICLGNHTGVQIIRKSKGMIDANFRRKGAREEKGTQEALKEPMLDFFKQLVGQMIFF